MDGLKTFIYCGAKLEIPEIVLIFWTSWRSSLLSSLPWVDRGASSWAPKEISTKLELELEPVETSTSTHLLVVICALLWLPIKETYVKYISAPKMKTHHTIPYTMKHRHRHQIDKLISNLHNKHLANNWSHHPRHPIFSSNSFHYNLIHILNSSLCMNH